MRLAKPAKKKSLAEIAQNSTILGLITSSDRKRLKMRRLGEICAQTL
jgi:hypothetical protein